VVIEEKEEFEVGKINKKIVRRKEKNLV